MTSKEDITQKYTKKQILEAYSNEHHAHKQTQARFNKLEKLNAQLRYERNRFMEDWLKLHIKENVEIVGDMDDAIWTVFNSDHKTFFTAGMGYYVCMFLEDCVFIAFAWYDGSKTEHKNMAALIRSIAREYQQPVRYTGINNVMANHSKDLGNNLYELVL